MEAIKFDTQCNMSVVWVGADPVPSLQKFFDGLSEHVRPRRLTPPYCMMVDEEGLLKGLPLNPVGCYLYETDKHNNPIVGDIYLLKDVKAPGGGYDIVPLTPKDIFNLGYVSLVAQKLKEAYQND